MHSFRGPPLEPVLLYSGGKDSLLCLKYLVDEGHDPTILHFHTKKISTYYEKLIKRNAMRVHRTPYYYTIKTDTENYVAIIENETGLYGVYLDEEGENVMYPHDYGKPVYIGYFKRDNKSMREGIDDMNLYRSELYKFPLQDLRQNRIIDRWKEFPEDIRKNTVSSTLLYFKKYGGKVVKAQEEDDAD